MTALNIFNNAASFTRPANTTAYVTGQLVANSTTAGSVVPLAIPVGGQTGFINMRLTRVRLTKSGTSATNANFTVHLYAVSPTCANGDGAAFSTNQSANWLGSISVSSMQAFTDGCTGTGSFAAGSEAFLKTSNVSGQSQQFIYALLQAQAAYTPVSGEAFTLTLEELSSW
jgi:hypothetical protein